MDLNLSVAPLQASSLLTTLICGAIVGIERQLAGKPAGIRTSCMICLGTYVFVVSGTGLEGDPTRVVGQVVTGVGFLGAGVMLAREGNIIGVTSAATIWVLAAIGVQIGLGHNLGAVLLSVITVGILVGVNMLENSFIALQSGVHKHITSLRRKKSRRSPQEEDLQ